MKRKCNFLLKTLRCAIVVLKSKKTPPFQDSPLPFQERTPFYTKHAATKRSQINGLNSCSLEYNITRLIRNESHIDNRYIMVHFKTEMTTNPLIDVVAVEQTYGALTRNIFLYLLKLKNPQYTCKARKK